jgi:hypothetical protein
VRSSLRLVRLRRGGFSAPKHLNFRMLRRVSDEILRSANSALLRMASFV